MYQFPVSNWTKIHCFQIIYLPSPHFGVIIENGLAKILFLDSPALHWLNYLFLRGETVRPRTYAPKGEGEGEGEGGGCVRSILNVPLFLYKRHTRWKGEGVIPFLRTY